MGAHIIIFLSLLYILHDRTYYGYRPFFWCCTKLEEVRDPKTAENPVFVPDYQLSNGHATSQKGKPIVGRLECAQDNDMLQERAKVYRVVDLMNLHVSSSAQ